MSNKNKRFSIFPDRRLKYDLENHGFEDIDDVHAYQFRNTGTDGQAESEEFEENITGQETTERVIDLNLDLGDIYHGQSKYDRRRSTTWKTLKPFRPSSRDGTIPINKAGMFSYLFLTWMTPLIWKMYRKRKEEIQDEDIWECSEPETCDINTQRLTRIWEEELQNYGGKKASFLRVWLKFSKTRVLLSLIFVAINATASFLESGYLLNLIVTYLEKSEIDLSYGMTLTGCIAACQIIRATSFCLIIVIGIQTGARFRAGYLGMAYNKLLRLKYLKGKGLSQMVTLFGADAFRVYTNCVTFVYILALPVYIVIGVTYTYILLDVWCFIAIGVFILCYMLQVYLTRIISKLRAKTVIFTDQRVRKMTEVLNSMKLIKMYAWEVSFEETVKGIRKLERKYLFMSSLTSSIMTAIIPITPTLASVLTLGLYKGFGNDISASTAFAVIGTLNFLRIIVSFIPFSTRMLGESRVSFKRMEKLLLEEEYELPGHICKDPENAIEVREATFKWDPSVTKTVPQEKVKKDDIKPTENSASLQLKDMNLDVKRGKLIGICGPVGSGKSSLMSALLGRMPMVSGHLAVSGTVAYAAQQAWIFNGTLRENVLFGKPYDPEWYKKVLSVCGLDPDIAILANGDETEIGDRGTNLSGGQKQRVSLARAVYSKSDTYLLDDVLSAVDVHVGSLLFHKCIRKTLKGHTVVLVTHQLQYLKHCHEIIVMENGIIVERGNHDSLLSQRGFYGSMINKFHNEDKTNHASTKSQLPSEAHQGSVESIKVQNSNDHVSNGQTANGHAASDQGKIDKAHESKKDRERKGKLTSAEEVGVGEISCSTYRSYISAAGGVGITVICLVCYCLTFGCVVFSDLWLAQWIETFEVSVSQDTSFYNSTTLSEGMNDNLKSTIWSTSYEATSAAMFPTNKMPMENHTILTDESGGIDIYLTVYMSTIAFILVMTIIRGLVGAATYIRAASRLHDRVLTNVMKAPMSFFDSNPAGRILNRLSKDQDEADVFIPNFLDSFLQIAFTIVMSLVTALVNVPWIGIAFLPVAVVYMVFKTVSRVSVRQFKRLENVARSPLLNHVNTSAQGLSTIITFKQQKQFMQTNQQFTDSSSVATFLFDICNRWIGLRLEMVSSVISLATAITLILTKGSIDPATAGLAYSMCVRVVGIMQFSIRLMYEVEARFTSIERLHEYEEKIEYESEVYDVTPADNWPNEGRVIFSNVEMKYRADMDPVLRNIRFDISPRQKIGIVGRTGAGKSSLAAAMFRLNELSGGHVYIDGIDVSKISLHLLRSKLSTIPQDPVLFAGTMRYNLDPFKQYTDDAIWSALELVHMKDKVKQNESQLDFLIEENGGNFSVGERQLICLARAILRRNKILLLDEATANIDTATDAKIQQTIRESFADCTVLTIAHRLNTVLHCDLIIILDAGKVMEMGTPQNLLSNPHSFFNSMMAAQTVQTPITT